MALQQRSTGRRIAQLRERAHLTQEVAADKAGVTLRAYQKWEAGGGIQYANLQKLADALGVTVDQVTGEAETPNPFRLADQMDGGFDEFREHVASLHARLERIESALADEMSERDRIAELVKRYGEQIETQNANLAAQTQLLEGFKRERKGIADTLVRIEGLVASLPTDETTRRLERALREAS